MLTRAYSCARAYRQSKLAQIMFAFDLAEELAGINFAVNCLHPATFMDTTMVRLSGVKPISTVREGGAAILQLVESSRSPAGAASISMASANCAPIPQAYDESARKKLRVLSFDLVGQRIRNPRWL